MKKKNIYIVLIISICLFVGLNVLNSNLKQSLGISKSSVSSVGLTEVETQTRLFKEKQNGIDKLKEDLNKNNLELTKTEVVKDDLDSKIVQITNQLSKLDKDLELEKQALANLKAKDNTDDLTIAPKITETETKLKETEIKFKEKTTLLNAVKTENQSKTAEIKSLQSTNQSIQNTLENKNSELSNQFSNVVNTFALLASNYVIYIILLVIYWLVYKSIRYLIHRDIINLTFKNASKLTVKIIWIMLSLGTIFYGLAGQFTYILTSLGFVSAALVFALQSFVSSFFVFVVLSITRIFKEGDIIKVGASFEGYTGKIISIGRFYTFIKEINADNHEEMGRTVSIPNSFLLTHPVTNYTFHNQVIWQNLEVTAKEGCDPIAVKDLLESVVNDKFDWVKQNIVEYLDIEANLSEIKPKVLLSLKDTGFLFTIHFPCRYDKYNEIYNLILEEIIVKFREEDIHFAFKL